MTAAKKRKKPKLGKVYSWRDGSRYGVKAEDFAKVVEAIEARDGRATAAAVVEAARDDDSPIHPMFCWDDDEAARRYREEQARGALRSLRVVVTIQEADKEAGPHIAYVNVHKGGERGYVNTQEVMASVGLREEAVETARRAFEALRERYRSLGRASEELAELFRVIDGWK